MFLNVFAFRFWLFEFIVAHMRMSSKHKRGLSNQSQEPSILFYSIELKSCQKKIGFVFILERRKCFSKEFEDLTSHICSRYISLFHFYCEFSYSFVVEFVCRCCDASLVILSRDRNKMIYILFKIMSHKVKKYQQKRKNN